MAEYLVEVKETGGRTFRVEANDAEDAQEKVERMIEDGEIDDETPEEDDRVAIVGSIIKMCGNCSRFISESQTRCERCGSL